MWKLEILIPGFPGVSDRGFLGWSTVAILGPKPLILFDTGTYGCRKVLLEKLQSLGYYPQNIDYLILSHSHYDHSMNWRLFPRAEILMHEVEFKYARECGDGHYLVDGKTLSEGLEKSGRLSIVTEKETELLKGITLLHTPGHTPGSMSALININEKIVALAGDAVKNIQEARDKKVAITMDPVNSSASIKKLIERSNLIIPGHDTTICIKENGELLRTKKAQVELTFPEGIASYNKEHLIIEI